MPYRETPATRAARERKREALLDAARTIVAEHGFVGANVQALAARAGVSTGGVYSYFPTKADLLVAVFRQAADVELHAVRTAAAARPDDPPGDRTVARLGRAVDTFARRALRGPTLAWALLLEPVHPAVDAARLEYRRAYAETFAEVVRAGVDAGEIPDQDVTVVATALVGAIGESLTGPLSPLAGGGPTGSDGTVPLAGDGSTASDGTVPPAVRDTVVATILRFCLGAVGARAAAAAPASDSA
ncbi:TetR/AcrR family transcriptional regulator [Cellulosimicrobium sp. 22601]|uniref:TetR/AcrR family transcriptional regulator n=1 Tax=unclassified Cellulosimicrobium TaxID=2624466 RepID=UPI003F841B40